MSIGDIFLSMFTTCGRSSYLIVTDALLQSKTSENGLMKPSFAKTGMHPVFNASERAVWPNRALRKIRQNMELVNI